MLLLLYNGSESLVVATAGKESHTKVVGVENIHVCTRDLHYGKVLTVDFRLLASRIGIKKPIWPECKAALVNGLY